MNGTSLHRCPARRRAWLTRPNWIAGEVFEEFRSALLGGRNKVVLAVVQPEELRIVRMAEVSSGLDNGIEDGLQLGGRAADDVEHVARRGLVLERLRQLSRARLLTLEQQLV